ncbi:MAG: hypothetical protein FJZ56_01860 [Chlamydiae bacterium]|nr:hypothetical protein [Chlamydiota bacterium]
MQWTRCLFLTVVSTFMHAKTIEDLNDLMIKTPSLSERKIAKIKLENGLTAFIVSDPGADQSAAALAVNVGAWHDPDNYEGMAHFTEHLLFLGTKNYPAEDELFQYCGTHGGLVNAYTWTDRTVYMFSVQNDAFEGGLARFSDFFKNPLFSKNGVQRELNAVNQEHAKNIESDNHRQWMILKTLGNPQHDNRKFSTGTAETLGRIPHEELVNWFSTHYSADRMYLTIYTKHPLDQATSWVEEYFAEIRNAKVEPLSYTKLLSREIEGHIVYQKPVRDLRNISLIWDVSSDYVTDLDKQTPTLIAYALNQKTPSSLYQCLKDEGLIENIDASYSHLGDKNGLFEISCDLTKQGALNYGEVIKRCYQAISTIQKNGVPEFIFQEMTKMAELRYEYQSRTNAFNFVSNAAHQMINESFSTFPRKQVSPTSYSYEETKSFAKTLIPAKAAVFFTVPCDLVSWKPTNKEKWYGTEYSIAKIDKNSLAAWGSPSSSESISICSVNPYLPDEVALVNKVKSDSFPIEPVLLENDSLGKLYFFSDAFYLAPKAEIYLAIKSKAIQDDPESEVMTDLLALCYQRQLSNVFSYANRAGIASSLERGDFCLQLSISGFSQKANTLVNDVFYQIKNTELEEKTFSLIKDELLSEYDSKTKQIAFSQANETLSHVLQNGSATSFQLYQTLLPLNFEKFKAFKAQFFDSIYIEGFAGGNLCEEDAKSLWKICKKELFSKPFGTKEHLQKSVLILPETGGPFAIAASSSMQGNAALIALQLGSHSYQKRACQLILGRAFQDAFFNQLRTKQQLGYIVRAWPTYMQDELILCMGAQSATYAPEELVIRFEAFAEEYQKNLSEEITEESFEKIKNALIVQYMEPPRNLQELSTRYFTYAYEFKGEFDRYLKIVNALKDLDYKGFIDSARAFLSRENTKRLAIQITGENRQALYKYKPCSKDELQACSQFVTKVVESDF